MYEQQARDEGIEGFSFKAIYEDGAVRTSPEKSEYYPVYYVEPLSGNEKALGVDLSSSQPRIKALLKSLQVNSVVASEGVKLVQEGKDYNGILLFLPIGNLNNGNQESFLIGVFKIKDMISSAFADSVHPDLIIHVYDLNDEDNLYPLASIVESEHSSTLPTIEELTDVNSLLNVSTIDIAGRQWALVIKPVNPIEYKDSEYFAWLVSLLLLAVMLLVAMYLYSQIRHASKNKEAHLQYLSLSEKLQAILNNTVDGIITINHRGVIQSVNKAALDMFGYSSEEMIGNNVNMFTPEPIRSEHDSYIKNYLDGKLPKVIGSGRDIEGVRKDGVKIPLRLGVSKAKVNDEVVFIGLLHDISERKNNERIKDEFIG